MTGEQPAWLVHLVDQRLALIEHAIGVTLPADISLVLSPLAEPDEGASPEQHARWDRTCDHCGRHCPDDQAFYTGSVQRQLRNGTMVVLTFGVCANCRW